MYIMLDSIDKVTSFVNSVAKEDAKLELISGKQEVDGKSLLGVFSLDLTKPIEVRVQKNKESVNLNRLLNKFEV